MREVESGSEVDRSSSVVGEAQNSRKNTIYGCFFLPVEGMGQCSSQGTAYMYLVYRNHHGICIPPILSISHYSNF